MPIPLLFLAARQISAPPALIPQPATMLQRSGQFVLARNTRIAVSPETAQLGRQLEAYLRPATQFPLDLTRRGGRNTIALELDSKLKLLGPEGYRLWVEPNRVIIRAWKRAGVFYGMQTLRELLPPDSMRAAPVKREEWTAPCVYIQDYPRFPWRGAHMDVARHFMPKSFVLKFLDVMALHKLNIFHWHLTDDTGWRIQIQQYPRLTEVASHMDYSSLNPRSATRSISVKPGGFYTRKDIREIVRYAAARFITIVPEIEMPGHSGAAILAYPDLGNRLQIQAAGGDASFLGNNDNVYNVDDSTLQFLENVLTEVMQLFPGPYIHVGGDEVSKRPWHENPQAQARMKALGLTDENELQSWFIRQMDDFLTSKGRRLVGWDEILEGGLAPGAVVMSWRGVDGGIAAAKSGHDVVMTPSHSTYLDHYQSRDRAHEPLAIGGYLPLRNVYAYDPIPPGMSDADAKHVLGAQGQLWSEFIPSPRHMEYMAYPRLCALAEVVWSPPENRSYPEFLKRLQVHLKRLKALGVEYRPLSAHDLLPEAPAQVAKAKLKRAFRTFAK